jgi:hypothetical protein
MLMNRIPRLVPAAWIACALVACSSGGGGDPASSQQIGPSGGTLSVTSGPLAGLSLVVPPNALASDVELSVRSVSAPNLTDFVTVGAAARFEPAGTQFASPATLTMTFDPSLIPAGRTTADLILKRQDTSGTVTDLTIDSIDTNANDLTASLSGFSVIWPVVPSGASLDWPFATLWPLGDGNLWEYDDDSSIFVVRAMQGLPPLPPTPLIEVSFYVEGEQFGVWLNETTDGTTRRFGEFEAVIGGLLYRLSDPQRFAPPVISNGTVVSSGPDAYTAYENPGAVQVGSGTVTYTGTFTWIGSLTVPAGRYDNVYRWDIDETWREGTAIDSSQSTIWLAPGVGPIQHRIDGVTRRMTSLTPGSGN